MMDDPKCRKNTIRLERFAQEATFSTMPKRCIVKVLDYKVLQLSLDSFPFQLLRRSKGKKAMNKE